MVNNRAGKDGRNIWVDPTDVNFKLRNSLIIGKSRGSSCLGPLRENVGNFIADGSCASMEGGDPLLGELTGAPEYFPLLGWQPGAGCCGRALLQRGGPARHCKTPWRWL